MGMVWVARLADADAIARIMAEPNAAYNFINPQEGWEEAAADTIDLDKEWHAAHHLLTGSAGATDSPLSLIIGDFHEIGDDNGYGPAWFIPPDRLQAFSLALTAIDDDELRRRYDPNSMVSEHVYIGDMYQEEGEEGFVFLRERITQLGKFADRAANAGLGAFAVIT
ncbi:MAG: YfbM family protein [Casimicrobium sp.]